MTGSNIKHLRNHINESQTVFGKRFNLTRGMVDSYEREVAKPDNETLEAIATHFRLTPEIMRSKDLKLNPGLLHTGAFTQDGYASDLLKAKDDLIIQLKERIKFLEEQNQTLLKQLSKKLA